MDYTNVCFVIMPFGEKKVGEKTVNFDRIYDTVFVPAIQATPLPEGGTLIPKRTDRDFFSGDISVEMFQYIEYSRFALADISGLNANVFYELGVRHRAREAGTAIFRQVDATIPFDISHIKAFPYEYEPDDKVQESCKLISRVLTESLQQNRLDSPVQVGLLPEQRQGPNIEGVLRDAENAIRNGDTATAVARYRTAIESHPQDAALRMTLGVLLKDQGDWKGALEQFQAAVQYAPTYTDALREKGIAENKLYCSQRKPAGMPSGEDSLRQAIELNPHDFDALASLGGILKREKRYDEALAMYQRATQESRGHPYPLLNEIKIRGRIEGKVALDDRLNFLLARAERALRPQVTNQPPYNAPWSFFDLSETRLYLGDQNEFLQLLDQGIKLCDVSWEPETHRDSLQLLADGGVTLPGLDQGMAKLAAAVAQLKDEEKYLASL